jgi:hypothetical protein
VKAGSRIQDTDLSGLRLLRDSLGKRFIAGFLLPAPAEAWSGQQLSRYSD